MVVKFMKWSRSMPPAATRKFNVKVKPLRLQGVQLDHETNKIDVEDEKKEKVLMLKIKWEGEQGKFLGIFNRNKSRLRRDFSSQRKLKKCDSIVEWDNDEFENICSFTIIGGDDNIKKFESPPWIVSFSLLYGEKGEQKGKMAVVGQVMVDIAEVASKMEAQVEQELLVKFHVGGVTREATLVVRLNFDEIREVQAGSILAGTTTSTDKQRAIGGSSRVSAEGVERLGLMTKSASFSSPITQSSMAKKMSFFSFKRRRLSKEEPLINNRFSIIISGVNKANDPVPEKSSSSPQPQESSDLQSSSGNEKQNEHISTDSWITKEITSRDGRTKLKTSMFFASFDQRSDKAAGESACSVLATVFSYWLHSNKCNMPTRSEFENLIIDGSSEWRKLCGADKYKNDFPNEHFDLETIMNADIRPIAISHNQSFICFFEPEKFECLTGVRSFNETWDEIEKGIGENEPRVYIISWNDHFFVMKFENDAIYIIDTLGERLFEGCSQAYILKFDESSEMAAKNDVEAEEELICSGRECCKEFIKRFFAAIPVEELEEVAKKKEVSYYSLHHRLQIEFNFSYPVYPLPSSSTTSSPFTHSFTSTPSPLHG